MINFDRVGWGFIIHRAVNAFAAGQVLISGECVTVIPDFLALRSIVQVKQLYAICQTEHLSIDFYKGNLLKCLPRA